MNTPLGLIVVRWPCPSEEGVCVSPLLGETDVRGSGALEAETKLTPRCQPGI